MSVSPAPDPRALVYAVLPEPRWGALSCSGYVPRTWLVRWPRERDAMYVAARAMRARKMAVVVMPDEPAFV